MFGHSLSDRSIKGNDPRMFGFVFRCELLKYVALIHFELFSSVGESEQVGIAGKVEHNGPIPVCSDWFG